jgi:hypothetical protein
MKILIPIALLLVVSTTAPAQNADVGEIDLASVAAAIDARPKVNINFGPAMMQGFAETFRSSNPELADVIASIAGLRLMVFEDIEGLDATTVRDRVSETTEALRRGGWTAALEVREDDADVDMFLNESDEFVKGLVLMVTEQGGTAVFANIYGDLDPVVIGKLIGSGDALQGLDFEQFAEQFKSMSENGDGETDES